MPGFARSGKTGTSAATIALTHLGAHTVQELALTNSVFCHPDDAAALAEHVEVAGLYVGTRTLLVSRCSVWLWEGDLGGV